MPAYGILPPLFPGYNPNLVGLRYDPELSRQLLSESEYADAETRPRIVVTVPSTARPGERIRVTIAALDALGNAGSRLTSPIQISAPAGLELPQELTLSERGVAHVDAVIDEPGIYRVHATAGSFAASSNPLVVREGIPRIVWGDLHGHSQLSD